MDSFNTTTPRLIPIQEALYQLGLSYPTYKLDPLRYPPVTYSTKNENGRKLMMSLDVATYVVSRGKFRTYYDFEIACRAATKQGVELIIGAPDDVACQDKEPL